MLRVKTYLYHLYSCLRTLLTLIMPIKSMHITDFLCLSRLTSCWLPALMNGTKIIYIHSSLRLFITAQTFILKRVMLVSVPQSCSWGEAFLTVLSRVLPKLNSNLNGNELILVQSLAVVNAGVRSSWRTVNACDQQRLLMRTQIQWWVLNSHHFMQTVQYPWPFQEILPTTT